MIRHISSTSGRKPAGRDFLAGSGWSTRHWTAPRSLAGSFDLVVLRGAFFFIMDNPAILTEIHRLLGPGGLGFAGGGYGREAPPAIVDGIAEESRRLNDALGRRRVSVRDLSRLLAATGLDGCTRIVEEGGVWLEMRCPESP